MIERKSHHIKPSAMTWSEDGTKLALIDQHKIVIIYDIAGDSEPIHLPLGGLKGLSSVDFHPDNALLAVGHSQGIAIFDVVTQASVWHIPTPDHGVNTVKYTPDGKKLVIAAYHDNSDPWGGGGMLYIYDTTSQHQLMAHAYEYPIYHLSVDPVGNRITWTGSDGIIHLWELMTHREIASFELPASSPATACAVFLNEETLFVDHEDDYGYSLRLWNPQKDYEIGLNNLSELPVDNLYRLPIYALQRGEKSTYEVVHLQSRKVVYSVKAYVQGCPNHYPYIAIHPMTKKLAWADSDRLSTWKQQDTQCLYIFDLYMQETIIKYS